MLEKYIYNLGKLQQDLILWDTMVIQKGNKPYIMDGGIIILAN